MIITSKEGVKAIEEFEKDILPQFKLMARMGQPLEEQHKLVFYSISRLFEHYDVFREFLVGIYLLFLQCSKNDNMVELIEKMKDISKEMGG